MGLSFSVYASRARPRPMRAVVAMAIPGKESRGGGLFSYDVQKTLPKTVDAMASDGMKRCTMWEDSSYVPMLLRTSSLEWSKGLSAQLAFPEWKTE